VVAVRATSAPHEVQTLLIELTGSAVYIEMGTLRGFPCPPASALRRAEPASALPLKGADARLTGAGTNDQVAIGMP